ncbi:hypothetical protein BDP27DRAFT_296884 [Rhodocollybia butyracea]|uniref:Uncharacterized protein n=1 Tax=Rhodocollybia butyracea TaxID=206335 RepID=A0A9P5PF32_9AGAR|nr:hypothetical protein BDP27DRAFT_296884 [Rhodocollybia butyracea]
MADTLVSSSSSAGALKLPAIASISPLSGVLAIEEARSRFYFTQGCFRSFLRCVAEQMLFWAIVVFLPDARSLRKLDIPSIQAMTLGCAMGRSIWSFMRYGVLSVRSPCPTSSPPLGSSFAFGFFIAILFVTAFTIYALLIPQWVRDEEAMDDGGVFSVYLRMKDWFQNDDLEAGISVIQRKREVEGD